MCLALTLLAFIAISMGLSLLGRALDREHERPRDSALDLEAHKLGLRRAPDETDAALALRCVRVLAARKAP